MCDKYHLSYTGYLSYNKLKTWLCALTYVISNYCGLLYLSPADLNEIQQPSRRCSHDARLIDQQKSGILSLAVSCYCDLRYVVLITYRSFTTTVSQHNSVTTRHNTSLSQHNTVTTQQCHNTTLSQHNSVTTQVSQHITVTTQHCHNTTVSQHNSVTTQNLWFFRRNI